MTRKNETQHWIKAKGHEKFSDTKPEKFVKEIMKEIYDAHFHFPEDYPFNALGGVGIDIKDEDGELITLHPDLRYDFNTIIETDGIYHDTPRQQSKTRWRDALLTRAGYRVIHIGSRLCDATWREYLRSELKKALESKEPIVRIEA